MIKRFLSYVEIKTKITSIFAFLMTIAFLFYNCRQIDWKKTAVFFASMFLFDLTTTAINNYIDTKANGQMLQFERRTALLIIYVLFVLSAVLGLYLAYLSDLVVLVLGALCFLCGVLYTYGPVPISRQPLGELLSGVFYGFFIPFILLYVNMPAGTYLTYDVSWDKIAVSLSVRPIAAVILLSIAPVCATANIMLANNICDVEKDVSVRRHTLPYYLGRKSLYLFAGIYYLTYASVLAMVALGILPLLCLLFMLTLYPVQRNIGIFFRKQEKATTFMVSIINYIIIMGTDTLLIFASALV